MSSRIVQGGRIIQAQSLAASSWLIAISPGFSALDGDWAATPYPKPPYVSTGVDSILCWVRPMISAYAVPDANGPYSDLEGNKYSHTNTPADRFLMTYEIPDGAVPVNTSIREAGLYYTPVIASGVGAGQMVLQPSDVTDPGSLYDLSWVPPEIMYAGKTHTRVFMSRP